MAIQKRFPTALVSGDYRASSLSLDGGSIIDQCIVTAGEQGTFFLEQHLLYVVLGGSVQLTHGQQSWTVGKNEMILLRKCQSITYKKTSDPATGLFESLLFGISGELLKDFLASQNVSPMTTTEEQGARVCQMSDRLVAYCRSLFPYFDQPERAEPALLRLKMMELLFDVMDCSKNTFRQMLQLRTPMRSDLRRVVEENITSPIGIDELAYLSGRSRSSFKREFQDIAALPMFPIGSVNRFFFPAHNEMRGASLLKQQTNTTMEITVEDFDKVDVRIGTIVAVDVNKKARHPAYKLTVDLGEEIGTKSSSAQITDLYTPEQLVGRQAVFCVNLKPMHIGSVKSEVRILGSESTGGVVLLQPTMQVKNGDRIF